MKKIYAYEIFEGDKGVIIAPSYKKAKKSCEKNVILKSLTTILHTTMETELICMK